MSIGPGSRLGPYEILALAGAGGMGEVYRALDPRLERIVAIKLLPQGFCKDPARLERFRREARLLAALNHPNIAAIYTIDEEEGRPYLVLEFVEGETLAARLARGPLVLEETVAAALQIASAIGAAHSKGVIHRDLKPGNIMLAPGGAVKVLDFGLACSMEQGPGATADAMGTTATTPGAVLGTWGYMSPEQARGEPLDGRSDIWSFGCVLFECLAGRAPFGGRTPAESLARALEREPEWQLLPAAIPPRMLSLLRRCLQKDQAEREGDIARLARDLSAVGADAPGLPGYVSPASAAPSIAVLDFDNLSTDKELEYFCTGITEDILTDLSKIGGLRVVSRSAAARYRGTAVDLPRMAAELNVAAVLQGSVRRAGDRLRITARLVDAARATQVWAERYDRTLQDVFAVQEEIASSIASALRVALTPAESEALLRDRPGDVRAYDLYLQGRHFYQRYTPESLRHALTLFREAAAIDPNYALAWAGIADCHGQMLQFEMAGNREEIARLGLEAARRAIALDPRRAEGHKAEALIWLFSDREKSKAALLRALEVNPRYTPAINNLAGILIGDADLAGALRLVRRAVAIDPHESLNLEWLSKILLWTGQHEEALALTRARKRLSSEPRQVADIHVVEASVHLARGDPEAALRTMSDGRADGGQAGELQAIAAAVAARAGRCDEARRAIAELEAAGGSNDEATIMAAAAALRCGDAAVAARLMSKPVVAWGADTLVRLRPELHATLESGSFAPPRRDAVLVWPAEAPPVDEHVAARFKSVRVETGLP